MAIFMWLFCFSAVFGFPGMNMIRSIGKGKWLSEENRGLNFRGSPTPTLYLLPGPLASSALSFPLAIGISSHLQGFLSHQQSWQLVKLSRSPSDCWDPIQSKINSLPLPQLHSDHPPRLQHYANQTPKLWASPETSNTLPSLSENSKWPLRTPITFLSSSVFIIPF